MFGPIGMPEMIVIAVIALIIFGPRKLPELGKSLGKSLAEFKRASNDLKNTLEEEIRTEELQDARKSAQIPPTSPTPTGSTPMAGTAEPEGETTPRESSARGTPASDDKNARSSLPRSAELEGLFRARRVRSWFEDDDPELGTGGKMSFLEHLDELRKRIVRALLALVRRLRHRPVLHSGSLCVRDAAFAADAPAGRNDDLHIPDRSVHAVPAHCADRRVVHRGAAHLLASMAVCRAGTVFARTALRDPVHRSVEYGGDFRRGVFALRRLSVDVALLRELLERPRVVHAPHRRRVQRLHADAAWAWRPCSRCPPWCFFWHGWA